MCLSENSRLLSKSKIVIVGGTGRMGRILTPLLKKGRGDIFLYSRDSRRAQRISDILGVRACTIQAVYDADYVIVSVPIEDIVDVCLKLVKKMKKKSAIIEISSIKTGIVDKIRESLPADIEYLSIHPLFGFGTKRFPGEGVLVINGEKGKLTDSFIQFLRTQGLKIIHISVGEHDRQMAGVQVMNHFALICLAITLAKNSLGKDPNLYTRSFRRTLDAIRMLNDNLPTVLSVQEHNPYSEWARLEFRKNVEKSLNPKNRTFSKISNYIRDL